MTWIVFGVFTWHFFLLYKTTWGISWFTFNNNCITTNITVMQQLDSPKCYFDFFFVDKIASGVGIWRLLYIFRYLYMRLCICGCLFVCMHTCVYCETAVRLIFMLFSVRGNWRATIMMLPLTLLQSLREFHLLHSLLLIFVFLGVLHDQPSPGPLLHIPPFSQRKNKNHRADADHPVSPHACVWRQNPPACLWLSRRHSLWCVPLCRVYWCGCETTTSFL